MNVLERFGSQYSSLNATLIGEPVGLRDGSEIALFRVDDQDYPAVVVYMTKGPEGISGASMYRHSDARVVRMGEGNFNRGVIAIAREQIERWESR